MNETPLHVEAYIHDLESKLAAVEKALRDEEEAHAALQARCFDYGNPTHTSIFDERDELLRRLVRIQNCLSASYPGEWTSLVRDIQEIIDAPARVVETRKETP